MKKEKLMRALNEIGDDLLHMAEHKQFPNPWKKWISTAACILLVVSLATLVLPYFPMGCGASSEAPKAEEPAITTETPGEPQMEEAVEESVAEPEEEPPMEEPALDGEKESQTAGTGTDMVVYGGTWYYLNYNVVLPAETPADLGEELGVTEDANRDHLLGRKVYAVANATWYDNHAVNGVSVPNQIYVETADGYVYGMTYNEKIISRYTADDVQAALTKGDDDWIMNTFAAPIEAQNCLAFLSGTSDSELLNRFFLASLHMNTGVSVAAQWQQGDKLVVPAEDVQWRLERFLDGFSYDPAETENYNEDSGCLVFSAEEAIRTINGLSLGVSSVENGILYLRVNLPESDDPYDEVFYTIRFDADSWRYLSRSTPG